MIKNAALFFQFIFFSIPFFAQNNIHHWETIVMGQEEWKYLPATSEPSSGWMQSDFDDQSWQIGIGGFGFGDGDDVTLVDTVSAIYLRKEFEVLDSSTIVYALLHADYDDAFIAYLNGIEIARSNIGRVGEMAAFDALPIYFHEAKMYQGGRPEYFEINHHVINNVLTEGINTLAIQVQNDEMSSDLSANFFLSVGIKDDSEYYQPIPDWFQRPVFLTSSNLPIIQINTNGQIILDDPRIIAEMKITNNGDLNNINDIPNEYDGQISLEYRGSSSQKRFIKKSYALETQLPDGTNNNVALLGMPEENDWILYGPLSDKTLLRNDIVYHFANEMGQYASRTAFCELVINEQYQGVYVFMEKIKRDKNRVNIAKLKPTDIEGDELTGGYIIKIDKQTGSGGQGWHSSVKPDEYLDRKVFFQYDYPKADEITAPQKDYIQQYIHDFETALFSDDFKDPEIGYRKYIDVKSFIDFFLANEISYNVDGYRLSVFMHKMKDSEGGKLHMGPVWDFNLSIGNGWDCEVQNRENYMYNYNEKCPGAFSQIPFWWGRLLEDEFFANELRCTWEGYRQGFLHTDSVMTYIDQQADYIAEAKDRNFVRWPIMEVKAHFNFFLGGSYNAELNYIKDWLRFRLGWLDNNLYGYCGVLSGTSGDQLKLILYPNPTENVTTFEFYLPQDSRVNLLLYDTQGRVVTRLIEDSLGKKGSVKFKFSTDHLPQGVYILSLFAVNEKRSFKLVKY